MNIRSAAFAGCTALCLTLPAFGQDYSTYNGPKLTNDQTVTLEYTGSYQSVALDYGAGIYSGKVNSNDAGITCDDFKDEVSNGVPWPAKAYQASSLNAGNIDETLYGRAIGMTGYAEVGYLVNMMFTSKDTSDADISAAIWDITDQGVFSRSLTAGAAALVHEVKAWYGHNPSGALAWLAQQTDLCILTPSSHNGPGHEPGQEMWIRTPKVGPTKPEGGLAVPEGGTALLYLLLAGMACVGAMRLGSRSRDGGKTA